MKNACDKHMEMSSSANDEDNLNCIRDMVKQIKKLKVNLLKMAGKT